MHFPLPKSSEDDLEIDAFIHKMSTEECHHKQIPQLNSKTSIDLKLNEISTNYRDKGEEEDEEEQEKVDKLISSILNDDEDDNPEGIQKKLRGVQSAQELPFHNKCNNIKRKEVSLQNMNYSLQPKKSQSQNGSPDHKLRFNNIDFEQIQEEGVEHSLTEKEIKLFSDHKKKSCSAKLIKVKNAIISISRLEKNCTRKINSIEELEDEFKKDKWKEIIPQLNQKDQQNTHLLANNHVQIKQKNYLEALEGMQRKQLLCTLCERGSQKDLEVIKKMLDSDPKRYLRGSKDPEHLLNQKDYRGLTPLYVACRSGNQQVVELLLEYKCDTLAKSIINGETETALEVAVRWNYEQLCQILIEKSNFSDEYLLKCLQLATNKKMNALISNNLKRKSAACSIF